MSHNAFRTALLVAAVALAAAALPGCDYGQQYTASRAYQDPAFKGTTGEFLLAYDDATTGGSAWINKNVELTGTVELKTTDEAGVPALVLRTGERNRSQRAGSVEFIRCVFHDRYRDQARPIQLGDVVTIAGIVMGRAQGDIVLRKCHLPIPNEPTTIEQRASFPTDG